MLGKVPRFAAGVVVGGVALLSANNAAADDLPAAKTLTLEVQGEIQEHCSLGSIPDLALGDLTTVSGEYRRHVALDCNIPIDIKVKSSNGGLANTAYPNGQGPYKGKLGYRLSLAMPIRKPATSVVTGTFQSAQLIGGGVLSSNGGVALDGMELTMRFDQLRGDDALLGGDYSEVIEITVSPS
jgi:hypothetical protein